MHKYLRSTCLLPLALLALGGHLQGQTFIRVATFNIANLGASDEYKRSLIALVNIIEQTDADLVAGRAFFFARSGVQNVHLFGLLGAPQQDIPRAAVLKPG